MIEVEHNGAMSLRSLTPEVTAPAGSTWLADDSGTRYLSAVMLHEIPAEVSAVLGASDQDRLEAAWETLVRSHTRLLLHVARSYGGDHDTVMDRYAFILERLRADNCRRLQSWAGDRRSKFTTWLVIVAQRLSLDQNRQRYGRPRGDPSRSENGRRLRRRLADLVSEQIEPEGVAPTSPVEGADVSVARDELSGLLTRSVSELEPSDQLLLTLRFEHGLSAAAIARTLSYPTPFHVYRHLDRLLHALREQLRRRGVEDPRP